MVSFLSANKRFGCTITNNCLSGKVGFSLTKDSLTFLTRSLYAYLTSEGISSIIIAGDSDPWSHTFKKTIAESLCKLSINVSTSKAPIPVFQLQWFLKQTKKERFGIYLSSMNCQEAHLGIWFLDEMGRPVTEHVLKRVLRKPSNIKELYTEELLEDHFLQEVDFSLYTKYLSDKALIPAPATLTGATIHIDSMFGATESLLKQLLGPVEILNEASKPPRLLHYIAKPTGKFLRWHTSLFPSNTKEFFFAIDNDGNSLGVFDLLQRMELSLSSVSLLLLTYLKQVKQVSQGKVLFTRTLSQNVFTYARSLGYTPVWVDAIPEEIGKEVIFYAGNAGNYYLLDPLKIGNPVIALFSIVELCLTLNKSPGQIVDEIQGTFRHTYQQANIFFDSNVIDKDKLETAFKGITNLKKVKLSKISTFTLTNKTRLVIKDNKVEQQLEVYIEAISAENLSDITSQIKKCLDIEIDSW